MFYCFITPCLLRPINPISLVHTDPRSHGDASFLACALKAEGGRSLGNKRVLTQHQTEVGCPAGPAPEPAWPLQAGCPHAVLHGPWPRVLPDRSLPQCNQGHVQVCAVAPQSLWSFVLVCLPSYMVAVPSHCHQLHCTGTPSFLLLSSN